MTRITISLQKQDADKLSRVARRKGMSVSALVRKALDKYLTPASGPDRLPFAALGRSGKKTTARDAEQILADEWRHDSHS